MTDPQAEVLFLEHAAMSYDKQLALGDFLGEHEWTLDLEAGTLTFTTGWFLFKKRRVFKIQVLGTESEVSRTWLWAWANEASNMPKAVMKAAADLREYGKTRRVPTLTTPKVALDDWSGHHLAMLASGIGGAQAYYRGPYEDGAVFLLITDASLKRADIPMPAVRVATVFPALVRTFEISNHQKALVAYVKQYRMEVATQGLLVTATSPRGDAVAARFDAQNRLQDMKVTVQGVPVDEAVEA